MGQVTATVVPRFKGIHRPGLTGQVSDRRPLDEPKEMYNFHLTDEGHLYMPDAATLVHDFSVDGVIKTIHYTETPRGVVVQMSNGKIYFMGMNAADNSWNPDPVVPELLATIDPAETEWNIWTNSTRAGYFLMGYCPRGSAGSGPDGGMWKVSGSSPYTVVDLRSTVGRASWSTMYKGRRFWVARGRTVSYSPLNSLDAEREGSFQISGDDAGNTYIDNPGFVMGMTAWEDVLVFFLTGSVWNLTGSGPDNWQLRQVQTIVGNENERTLVRSDEGVFSVAGENLNNLGLYLYTGANSIKLSDVIDQWFRDYGTLSATVSAGRYVLGTSRDGADNRQFLIYDIRNRQWTAFDGFTNGTVSVRHDKLYMTKEGQFYEAERDIFPRAPGRGARITLGYHDEENPAGLNRYIALKLAGRMWGTGTATVTVTATTPEGVTISGPHDIPTDVFDALVLPLNVRGAAMELELAFTSANDDNELLIENLQLVSSRKGEKVSRG